MTRIEPTLALNRLVVFGRGKTMYDQAFHLGVNIIRGMNSSGKSTIADFIFYALGGEGIKWKPEALMADFVVAEVLLNGVPVTLRRPVSAEQSRPMSIFWGPASAALATSDSGWQQYPYARRTDLQSFSQVLFDALKLPQVKGSLASSLTMHQLLRLIYSDQMTAPGKLFRHEEFDKKLTRDAVGSYLCGFFDEKLYDAEIELRSSQDTLAQVVGELRQIVSFLGSEELLPTFFEEKVRSAELEISSLYGRIKEGRDGKLMANRDKSTAELLARGQEQFEAVGRLVLKLKTEIESLEFEIADSDAYLAAIDAQLQALDDSLLSRKSLGSIAFVTCPSCGELLAPQSEAHCHLCKAPQRGKDPDAAFLRMQQELRLQLAESRSLQEDRKSTLVAKRAELKVAQGNRRSLESNLRDLSATVDSDDSRVQQLYRDVGYREREIEELRKKEKLAKSLAQLRAQRDEVQKRIQRLSDEIHDRRSGEASRRAKSKSLVSQIVAKLLRQDLDREGVFEKATHVDFSFEDDSIVVDGRDAFSASSLVVLKNSFNLALLAASTSESYIRFPRFVLFDNIEDKGMEQERSQNFQRMIVALSRASTVEHQIVFTTSMIAPDLDVSELVVGEFYTKASKTLRL